MKMIQFAQLCFVGWKLFRHFWQNWCHVSKNECFGGRFNLFHGIYGCGKLEYSKMTRHRILSEHRECIAVRMKVHFLSNIDHSMVRKEVFVCSIPFMILLEPIWTSHNLTTHAVWRPAWDISDGHRQAGGLTIVKYISLSEYATNLYQTWYTIGPWMLVLCDKILQL